MNLIQLNLLKQTLTLHASDEELELLINNAGINKRFVKLDDTYYNADHIQYWSIIKNDEDSPLDEFKTPPEKPKTSKILSWRDRID